MAYEASGLSHKHLHKKILLGGSIQIIIETNSEDSTRNTESNSDWIVAFTTLLKRNKGYREVNAWGLSQNSTLYLKNDEGKGWLMGTKGHESK